MKKSGSFVNGGNAPVSTRVSGAAKQQKKRGPAKKTPDKEKKDEGYRITSSDGFVDRGGGGAW